MWVCEQDRGGGGGGEKQRTNRQPYKRCDCFTHASIYLLNIFFVRLGWRVTTRLHTREKRSTKRYQNKFKCNGSDLVKHLSFFFIIHI